MPPRRTRQTKGCLQKILTLMSILSFTHVGQAQDVASADSSAESHGTIPGGVYVWKLPHGTDNVTFNDQPTMIVNGYALAGIHINTAPGSGELHYDLNGARHTHTFDIRPKQYTEQHITIENQNMVDPPAETLARIREESQRQGRAYRNHRPQHSVASGFMRPLEGIVTSLFGHRRFFNGKPRSPHSGLDIAADTGTQVLAAGDAVVTLADDLYFNGNTLFLDHGQGLITMYCHLSKHLVAEGEEVSKGQPIGLVGATGRATGPHLHWSVSMNGSRVDPELFTAALNGITAGQ